MNDDATPAMRRGTFRQSRIAQIAIVIHSVLLAALAGVCGFDDGKLAHDWTDCLIPLGLVLVPLVLAIIGMARNSSASLIAAAVAGGVVGLVSLTGPGLFVLLPAILYGLTAGRIDPPGPG
jgi:TRAP-type uncharacterized transport system fused permease subunit